MSVMPQRLRAALDAHTPAFHAALPGRTNHLQAGIVVPVLWSEQPRILTILRSAELRRHSNEVGFPGGKPEPEDADIEATALRETREELGLRSVEVLGRLSSFPLYTSDYRLEPFLALADGAELEPEPGEVAEVLPVDVRAWLSKAEWEGVPYEIDGAVWVSPVFVLEGHVMYGGSAHVLYEAMGLLASALQQPLPPLTSRQFTPDDILGMALRNA